MNYIDALHVLHSVLLPKSYCEIGCRFGYSLAVSRCPSVGIDPDFEIKAELAAPTRLFRTTSDDFFARPDLSSILAQPPDLAFIDGMHLVEFALRDFMNLERNMPTTGVIAIDDVLPQAMEYASRTRNTQIWTGDVYRLIPILRHYRPDLDIQVYDVELKGLAVIRGLDPSSAVLFNSYTQIEAELAAGKWSYPTIDAVRGSLSPRSPKTLEADIMRKTDLPDTPRPPAAHDEKTLYLDLLKRSLLNEIYLDDELRILYLRGCLEGGEQYDPATLHDIREARRASYEKLAASRNVGQFFDRDIHKSGFSHSMMGRKRLDSLHDCLDMIRREETPGDIIECGVWRGGGCILAAGYLNAYDMDEKRVFVADSFEGLPPPSVAQDQGLDLSKGRFPELAVSENTVRENFAAYGLDRSNIVFLKGWFKDTLPKAPVEQIALLRLDGDLYESTMDALQSLYDKVVAGGIVIIDDYNALEVCRRAVNDFFARRREPLPELTIIDWTGVWFRKPEGPARSAVSMGGSRPKPKLSVVICAYDMPRELPRTMLSAVVPYQKGIKSEDYEVIVVENGSNSPVSRESLPNGIAVHDMPSPRPSPVFALNWAVREIARGDLLLLAIDGARIFSQCLYERIMAAHRLVDDAFIYTLGWHIGPKVQMQSVQEGYNQSVEDGLIARSGWPDHPDALFDISVLAGSSMPGFFDDISESNAFSITRSLFDRIGGFDERFVSPGGGLANLEMFARYVTRAKARNVCLLGEGTFHQVHGGIATSGRTAWKTMADEYQAIFGHTFEKPRYDRLYYGSPRPAVGPFLTQSAKSA